MRLLIFILMLISFCAEAQIGMQLGRTPVSTPPVTYNTEPDDISNLIAWWETDTLVTESSGVVSAWEDQIGGYTVSQNISAFRPTYSSSVSVLNNQPGILFDGFNDRLFMSTVVQKGSDFTLIVVCHPETSTAEGRLVGWEFRSSEKSLIAIRLYDNNTSVAYGYTGVQYEVSPSGTFSDNTTHMFTGVYEEQVGITAWRDKTKSTTISVSGTWDDNGQSDRFRIGTNRSATGQFFDGYILCVLIYSKLLSDTEIENLYDDYFAQKYGI